MSKVCGPFWYRPGLNLLARDGWDLFTVQLHGGDNDAAVAVNVERSARVTRQSVDDAVVRRLVGVVSTDDTHTQPDRPRLRHLHRTQARVSLFRQWRNAARLHHVKIYNTVDTKCTLSSTHYTVQCTLLETYSTDNTKPEMYCKDVLWTNKGNRFIGNLGVYSRLLNWGPKKFGRCGIAVESPLHGPMHITSRNIL